MESFLAEKVDPDALINSVMDRDTLDKLLDAAAGQNSDIGSLDRRKYHMDAGTYLTGEELKAVKDYQSLNNEELKGHMALFQYEKMMDALREAQEGLDNMVEGANDGFSRSMDQTFIYDGYKLQGSTYVKEVCEGATLMDVLREKYYVKTFKYFADYQSDFDQHLVSEDIDAKNLSFEAIQSLIGKGMNQVEEERTEIFGDPEEDPIYTEQRADKEEAKEKGFFESLADSFTGKGKKQASYDKTVQQVTADQAKKINEQIKADNDKLRRVVEEAPGTFNSHIGYAPMLKEDADPEKSLRNNVLFSGKGEMGRMMGTFMQNSLIHAAGNAEASKPMYDRKLWDDRGSPIGAPNIRTVTEIGVAVAATVATGGMGGPAILGALAVAGIGMADDLAFAALDTLHYSGRKNGNEMIGNTWSGFAKKGATSLVTSSIGAGFSEIGSTGSVLGDMALTGTQGVYTNVASSALNSWDWQDGSFDMQSFTDGFAGQDAMPGYLASMAGTGVTSGLNTQTFGFINDTKFNADALTGLAGGLTTSAFQYGLTGETTLNLARMQGTGLLELHLGGDGKLLNMGMGGTDVSFGKLKSAYAGLDAFKENSKIKHSGVDSEYYAAMRTLFSAGMGETDALYRDIMAGDALLRRQDGADYRGLTDRDAEGHRIVNLNTTGQSDLDLSVLLTHEAFRDGYDNGQQGQAEETMAAAFGHIQVAAALQNTYGSRFMNASNNSEAERFMNAVQTGDFGSLAGYVAGNYDASDDYWRLMDDGSIVWDGKKDLYDEDGNRIEDAYNEEGRRLTWNESLAKFTGMTSSQAGAAMSKLGAKWEPTVRDEEGNIIQMGYLYSSKDGVTLFNDPDFSFRATDALISKWLTDPTSSFQQTGEIQRAKVNAYSQQMMETEWTGAPLDWEQGNGYCNIMTMATGFAKSTGFSEEEYSEALQAEWESIRTDPSRPDYDPDFNPDYVNIETGWISDYNDLASAFLNSLSINEQYIFSTQGSDLSQMEAFQLSMQLLENGYSNNDIYISGYYQHENNGELTGGHFMNLDMTGTLTNSYNGSTIFWDDYQNQYMNVYTLQEIPWGLQR